MKAGFTLAALLLDDRDLAQVERALPSGSAAGFEAELAWLLGSRADSPASTARDRGVNALLRVLRPELTVAGAGQLPSRAQALIARLFPASARQALAERAPSPRPDFVLDEELLRVLVRMARSTSAAERP